MEEAIFGDGCFWCTEAIFQRLRGVEKVESEYSGGKTENPTYEQVCNGDTGHVEVIRITFNPAIIPFKTLLEVFFETHDPTTLNRQGNDVGTQYRSVIFYTTEAQKTEAESYIKTLGETKRSMSLIVTRVEPAENFYKAESYHQNYFNENQNKPYCSIIISPKLDKLREKFSPITKES